MTDDLTSRVQCGRPDDDRHNRCSCGDRDPDDGLCLHEATGYILCRTCEEVHRPPECHVDAQGYALAWCGCRWVDLEGDGQHACEAQ